MTDADTIRAGVRLVHGYWQDQGVEEEMLAALARLEEKARRVAYLEDPQAQAAENRWWSTFDAAVTCSHRGTVELGDCCSVATEAHGFTPDNYKGPGR